MNAYWYNDKFGIKCSRYVKPYYKREQNNACNSYIWETMDNKVIAILDELIGCYNITIYSWIGFERNILLDLNKKEYKFEKVIEMINTSILDFNFIFLDKKYVNLL